jgi:hypothetical protein
MRGDDSALSSLPEGVRGINALNLHHPLRPAPSNEVKIIHLPLVRESIKGEFNL